MLSASRTMSVSSLSEKLSFESLRSCSSSPSVLSEPDFLPPPVNGPMAWKGDELNPKDYVVELDSSEVQNIRAAVVSFKLLGLPRGSINVDTFPLQPALARKLSNISDNIHHGTGASVVRGLHTARFNDEESVIAFAGVCSYICPKRATDSYANQTLSHIRDASRDAVPAYAKDLGLAGSKLPSAMDFHCDRFSGDVLAMHVRNDGAAGGGGEQFVASFWTIYNELLNRDPTALETLAAAEWPFELKNPTAKLPYLERGPALFFAQGKPMCQLVKAPLLGSPRIPRSNHIPAVSPEQIHALQAVEDVARRVCAKVDRQQGDIQFINNLSIMHARAAYGAKTSQDPSSRHLLRMFLRDPRNAWEKPESYREKFDDPFTDGRPQNLPIIDSDPWRRISGRESHG